MPTLTTVPVPARQLKAGDKVTLLSEGILGATVDSKDSKTKYTYLTLEVNEGMSLDYRLDNETVFQVEREVPTEEEKAAADLKNRLRSLDYREERDREALAAAREKMRTDMEAGVRADHWHWMDVPAAQAKVDLWDRVAHVHQIRCQKDGAEPITRIEAVRLIARAETKQSLSYYRALSRSTSVISNLFDDLKIEALSSWLRDLEWIIDIED